MEKVTPLFRYVGGKSWMRDILRTEFDALLKSQPEKIENYCEPFAGGLGVFLNVYDILKENGIKNILINDINGKLINIYKAIQFESEKFLKDYMKIENAFAKKIPVSEEKNDKDGLLNAYNYYKEIRKIYNLSKLKGNKVNTKIAAQLFFLQNHCFNGIYRENGSGQYNTSFNWSDKKFNKKDIWENILSIKSVFEDFNITFSALSYKEINYIPGTFYYLDPPYINDKEDTAENKYHKLGFDVKDQKYLIKKLKNIVFIYSNHDNEILEESFKEFSNERDLVIKRIPRRNIISAKSETRSVEKIELLVIGK